MKRTLQSLVLAGLISIGVGPSSISAQPPAKKEPSKLDGVWEGFVVDGKGEKPNAGPMQIRLTIKGDAMSGHDLRAKKELGEGKFKVDAAKKELDATGDVMGAGRNRTFLGIYEVDGDTLKWCVSNFQVKTHPEDFSSKRAQYLMILKKQKE